MVPNRRSSNVGDDAVRWWRLLIVYFQLCSMIWLVLSFRPDLDPALAGLLDDAARLIFVMVFPS
jgi:hypothetical protein